MAIGIDFGTTNSVLAYADTSGVTVQEFQLQGKRVSNFNSVLFFPDEITAGSPVVATGVGAMEAYFEHEACGRLLQSLKSFLTSSFSSTRIRSRQYTLEDLIALLLKGLLAEVPRELLEGASPIVVGRPVTFVNAESAADNAHAEDRLRAACALAGLTNVVFEYEPVAAAFSYEQRLTREELLLVGDFGGGTSDFTLIRVGPDAAKLPSSHRILGTSGVGVAGDAFDACIVRNKVVSHFGKGAHYAAQNGAILEIPHWIYSHVSNWHQLAMLKDQKNIKLLHDIAMLAKGGARQGIEWLLLLIRENLSYFLYQCVADAKASLSSSDSTTLRFRRDTIKIQEQITRLAFEEWITQPLQKIRRSVDEVLTQSGVDKSDVHRVFLTGGSAFVPAVRGLFADLFGAEKLAGGNEFTSVAGGLALRAYALNR